MGAKLEKVQTGLQAFAGAMNENYYMKSVSGGLMAALPVIILGAFSTLLANLGIESYQNFLQSSGLGSIIQIPNMMTIGVISLFVVFFIAYTLANLFGEDGAGAGLIALVSFLILTPIAQLEEANVLPFQYLGAPGIFSAIIVGLSSARLFVYIKQKGWTIKMPAGVPPTVSKSFSNLIPGLLIPVLFLIVTGLFAMTSYGSLHSAVYSAIQAPLQDLGSGFWSLVIVVLIINLLWFLGIHGGLVMMPILLTVWMPLGLENLDAIANGNEPPNIVSLALYSEFISLGGAGATLGLVVLMTFFAKSKRYKTLGKLALPPSLFSINEPVIFGAPIVLNPYLFVPFIVTPVVIAISTYFVMTVGILPIANGTPMPIGSPLVIGGFVQGGILLALWQLVCVAFSMLSYYPFFRNLDKQALKDERQLEEDEDSKENSKENSANAL